MKRFQWNWLGSVLEEAETAGIWHSWKTFCCLFYLLFFYGYLLALRWRLCYRLTCVEFLDVVSGILQIVEHVRRGAHSLKRGKQLTKFFFELRAQIFVKFATPFFKPTKSPTWINCSVTNQFPRVGISVREGCSRSVCQKRFGFDTIYISFTAVGGWGGGKGRSSQCFPVRFLSATESEKLPKPSMKKINSVISL